MNNGNGQVVIAAAENQWWKKFDAFSYLKYCQPDCLFSKRILLLHKLQ
jgi:hypothetical protein